jgi:SAM-dependent methyltransferase
VPEPGAGVQSKAELEDFYAEPDPWHYDEVADDAARVARLLAAIPPRDYDRTLDVGCGNGFVTAQLPGRERVGIDLSERAVAYAAERVPTTEERPVRFLAGSLFEADPAELGTFDLVVITGVLYPQYIGGGRVVAVERIKALLRPGAIVASVHIDEWDAPRLPLTTLTISVDRYREYFHRLEIHQHT